MEEEDLIKVEEGVEEEDNVSDNVSENDLHLIFQSHIISRTNANNWGVCIVCACSLSLTK